MNRRRIVDLLLGLAGMAAVVGMVLGLGAFSSRLGNRGESQIRAAADAAGPGSVPARREGLERPQASQAPRPTTPATPATPIKHLIVLMQENHSFDNYFGTYPGADGIPPGTCLPVDPTHAAGAACVAPFHLGQSRVKLKDDDEHIQVVDLDHSAATFRAQYNGGRMDGFVYALNERKQDGRVAVGFYDDRDLPYYWNIADDYVLFDRFFSSAAAGSFINHLYWVAAASGGAHDGIPRDGLRHLPTIFDRLEEQGISWKFYVQNYDPQLTYRTLDRYVGNRASQVVWAPLLAIDRFVDDPRLFGRIVDLSEYFDDLQNGTLPAVAYLVPSGASEHPPGSIASGQRFVVSLIHALMRSSAWDSSAFMWTYDDWGGWYDHVPPPQVDPDGYGFRVPALLVSPYARRGHVEHAVLDYASIIRFIEENWGLEPLGQRDTLATSIAGAFDFSSGPRPPRFISPQRGGAKRVESPRGLIYTAYGGALAFAGLTVAWAAGGAGAAARYPLPAPLRRPRPSPVVVWYQRPAPRRAGRIGRIHWLRWLLAGAALIAVAAALALRFAGGAPGGERTATDAVATDDAPPAAPGGSAAQTRSRQDAVGAAGAAAPAAGQTPRTILDERFAARPLNWPDDPASTAWFDGVDGGGYRLVAREPSRFVAVGAPPSAPLGDAVVQAAFRKVGGPAGGGYGIIVRDQGPGPRDGVHQGGRYYVLEAGDRGEVGIWRREGDRWVDLLPWTASGAVRPGSEPNELEVRAMGPHLSFFVNGALAASVIDTELTAGRVGVFVGGDLNEVVLDRFVVQAPIP